MTSLKLYGVPLSQPFRSVAWALLQKKVPFEVKLAVPAMKSKVGAQGPEFLAKNPLGTVPVIEEPDGFCLCESPAILTYLADSRPDAFSDLYPTDPKARAKINGFMSWHHSGTRSLAMVLKPHIRPDLGVMDETQKAAVEAAAHSTLETLGRVFLADSPFLAGSTSASFADLLAYEEVIQLPASKLLAIEDATVQAWMEKMEQLPYHDEVHASLTTLGDLKSPNETPMQKRLGAATKAGLEAIKAAAAA